MNEFYNLILKQIYVVSLSFKERLFSNYIAHIKNFKGGRIDGLRFSKVSVFKKLHASVIQNIIGFIPHK